MLPIERDKARLETILLLIERIEIRLGQTNRHRFVDDLDDIDLLSYRLAMIGEYARKLSDELKARYPEMPWSLMYGMRNIITHEYRRVSPDRIWATATEELNDLAALCRKELEQFPD